MPRDVSGDVSRCVARGVPRGVSCVVWCIASCGVSCVVWCNASCGVSFSLIFISIFTVSTDIIESDLKVNLTDKGDGVISNVNYPFFSPINLIQTLYVTTMFNSNVRLIFTQIEFQSANHLSFIEVVDNTLNNNVVTIVNITSSNYQGVINRTLISRLNSMRIKIYSGSHGSRVRFRVMYNSIFGE